MGNISVVLLVHVTIDAHLPNYNSDTTERANVYML